MLLDSAYCLADPDAAGIPYCAHTVGSWAHNAEALLLLMGLDAMQGAGTTSHNVFVIRCRSDLSNGAERYLRSSR